MTDKYAVFGNPIEHSLSPLIHNYFAYLAKLDISYDKILVTNTFKESADAFFKEGKGCNITVPFKLDAYNYADIVSDRAKRAGAVNTLKKIDDGHFFGENTDGDGLCLDLKRLGLNLLDKKVLIIGAGGACRGIVEPIFEENVKELVIVNRTHSKAKALASYFATELKTDKIKAIAFEDINKKALGFDVIINSSASSLHKELPNLNDEVLKKAQFVYDLMYTKNATTCFTEHAKALGVPYCYDGLGMLVCQAAISFKRWTNADVDIKKTLDYLRDHLKG